MDVLAECFSTRAQARDRLVEQLREHALVIREVRLTSGALAQYYVDAKRAILRPPAFAALAGGAQAKAFFIRKEAKEHGLQRRIEGPPLTAEDRCVVVEDVVTTGGSTLAAIEALHEAGHTICGVVSVLDRLAGGGAAIEKAAGAPYVALSTIDDVYPDRPDRAEA
jgi:orotate phosphoribosyltransferase